VDAEINDANKVSAARDVLLVPDWGMINTKASTRFEYLAHVDGRTSLTQSSSDCRIGNLQDKITSDGPRTTGNLLRALQNV
jgi:hypothetical protein